MTPLQNFSAALHVAFAAMLLWYLLFRCVRDYRIDALRNRLFTVRDKLFDYAAEGNVAFDHPAYTKLRMLLNSLIRFGHRLTFSRFAMGILFMIWMKQECDEKPLQEWYAALKELPEEPRKKLTEFHSQAIVLVVKHLISGSPIMVCAFLIFALSILGVDSRLPWR